MTLNGAAYRIEQKGIQLSIPDPCGIQFYANAGDARIDGAELDMSLRPSRPVTISGQMSYTDARFSNVPADFGASRSEERRVGKASGSTCRSRWWPSQ